MPEINIDDLVSSIDRMLFELECNLNSTILALFWKIGNLLDINNKFENEVKLTDYDFLISAFPQHKCNSLFQTENVNKYIQFYRSIPDQNLAAELGQLMNWDCISILLELNNINKQLYFFALTVRDSLNYSSLTTLIKNSSTNTKNNECQYDLMLSKLILVNDHKEFKCKSLEVLIPFLMPLINYNACSKIILIKKETIEIFKATIQPVDKEFTIKNESRIGNIEEKLTQLMHNELHLFHEIHNIKINFTLNRIQWYLGNTIKQFLYKLDESVKEEAYLIILSNSLNNKYGGGFTVNKLNQALLYSRKFEKFVDSARIAKLVSWDHLTVLLTLNTIEEIFYFARLTAKNGLNRNALEKIINSMNNNLSAILLQKEIELIKSIQIPITELSTQHFDNYRISLQTQYYNLGEDIKESLAMNDLFSVELSPLLSHVFDKK